MQKPSDLTDRDWQIVTHVYRYRVSSTPVIWQQFFADLESGAARNVVRRLVTEGWLRKWPLEGQRHFLTLDTRGAFACHLRERSPARFSEQALPGMFAVLHFCLRNGYERLTPPELRAIDPQFDTPAGWAHAYYVHRAERGLCLSCCLIDRRKSPRRLVTRARDLIVARYKVPQFRSLIQAGQFTVTILTAYAGGVEPIVDEVRRRHSGPVRIQVEAVPEFAEYLPSRQ